MSAHTPTPWADPRFDGAPGSIWTTDGSKQIASCDWRDAEGNNTCAELADSMDERRANAAHIVRCVNAHDALVAAAERLILEAIHFRDAGVGAQFLTAAIENMRAEVSHV